MTVALELAGIVLTFAWLLFGVCHLYWYTDWTRLVFCALWLAAAVPLAVRAVLTGASLKSALLASAATYLWYQTGNAWRQWRIPSPIRRGDLLPTPGHDGWYMADVGPPPMIND